MAGAVPQTALNWLHSVLINDYHNVNRTYSDVAYTLQQHPNLKLKTDVYTFDHGASALLLNLQHTLPVTFRGTTYGFPISLWIPQEYPATAPLGFVIPSRDMAIRAGQHVSGEGRIYHPYLASWRPERSNVAELLTLLQQVFSQEPPLVARAQQGSRAPAPLQHQGTPPPIPPLPPKPGSQGDASSQDPHNRPLGRPGDQPAPPPKPPKGDAGPRSKYDRPAPLPPSAVSDDSYTTPQSSTVSNSHIPRPHMARQPLQQSTSDFDPSMQAQYRRPSGGHWQQNTSYQQNDRASFASPTSLSHRGPPPNQVHQYRAQDVPRPYNQSTPSYPTEPRSSQPTQPTQNAYQPPQPTQYAYQSHSVPPPKPKPPPDLLTSLMDNALPPPTAHVAPPPIPPNPQKDALLSAISQTLTQQIEAAHASTESAIPPLRAQQAALTSTLNSINREVSQLDDLESLLCSNEGILRQSMRDADNVLEEAKRRKVPNVDEVLVAPTVVAGQLYQAVAEQRAIEDCRNALGKALDRGRISGNVWAKQSRSLAREEFMKKALIKKIAKGMGLAEEREWH